MDRDGDYERTGRGVDTTDQRLQEVFAEVQTSSWVRTLMKQWLSLSNSTTICFVKFYNPGCLWVSAPVAKEFDI